MAAHKTKAAFQTSQTSEDILIEGSGYTLQISRHNPEMTLFLGKRQIATLNLASALDTVEAFDEETTLEPPILDQKLAGFAVVTWKGSSKRWAEKQIELHAGDDGFSYGYSVTGEGILDRAHFWRTRLNGTPAHAVRLFNPEPNSRMVRYTGDTCLPELGECPLCHPKEGEPKYPDLMTISVGRDKSYHGGNWLFTPAPFCYAVEGEDNWLSLGIAAQPGEWNFSDYFYPGDGFGFSLIYEGHVTVKGKWQSPRMLCLVAPDEYSAVERYCDALRILNLAPDQGRGPIQEWWREPIFCGWGEQVSQEVHQGEPKAPARSTQSNYQNWLHILEEHQINPGTVVIDDKWQLHYGLNDLDMVKWPALPTFIAKQHKLGRRVLLWLKAWDPEGVPPEECILDETGQPVAVDPGNPAYRKRFSEQVRWMLQTLDADGFKIDFTHLIPRGPNQEHAATLQQRDTQAGDWISQRSPVGTSAGGKWGLELMREWLQILSEAARQVKSDAMIITHTANPYLADLVDVLRLNDIAGLKDIRGSILPDMEHRARIARMASPYWLIDSDNWPCSSREQWREYIRAQTDGKFGIPSVYHAVRFGWQKIDELLEEEDYATIRECWTKYREMLADSSKIPATGEEVEVSQARAVSTI